MKWTAAASDDLNAIVDYIAEDDPGAALRLLDEIVEKVEELPENPKAFRRGRVDGTREFVVRANYVIVYSENPDLVRILRVLHAARMWPT
ncbi:type II toxin-antitoxin system RelE/ParE family toxin [Roseivivax marinus]|uniref:type II toxin-antitoxin system RelE/ParE family toxin n=1 Tax=Roseivivax marinus TaxID=1379903 RepID=UPI003B9728B0